MEVSDGGTPTTGIYRLTETRSGDCQTLQPDDTIDAYVVADGTSWLLDLSAPWFGDPSAALGPALIVEPDGGSELDDPICAGVVDHRAFTVELATPDHLRARFVDTFSHVAGATADCPAGRVPVADCMQTTELDYVLVEPCSSSCIQSAPILRCSC